MTVALRLSGVLKTQKVPFSRRPAFKLGPLDLSVEEGEIVGLLGANGAGKTTTLKVIMSLLEPDSGVIELVGQPASSASWSAQVGYLPEQPAFYDYLSGREFLNFAAELFGFPRKGLSSRVDSLLERVGLAASATKRIRTYSKGMQQRLGIAQALLNEPKLLILDEPMSGLDPLGRRFVRDLLLQLKSQGCSILFSTHVIPDAEFVCDRIAILNAGRLSAIGTLDQLLGIPTEFEIASTNPNPEVASDVAGLFGRSTVRVAAKDLSSTLDGLLKQGSHVVSVSPLRASVEDLLEAAPKVSR